MLKPISFVMNGGMIDVIVKKTDPQMKMSRRPYTSANLPHSNYFSISRFLFKEISRIYQEATEGKIVR